MKFCENYFKIINEAKRQITSRREDHDISILKEPDKNAEGIYKVQDDKIILSKIV